MKAPLVYNDAQAAQAVPVATPVPAAPVMGVPISFVGAQISRGTEWLTTIDALFIRLKIDIFEQVTGCAELGICLYQILFFIEYW